MRLVVALGLVALTTYATSKGPLRAWWERPAHPVNLAILRIACCLVILAMLTRYPSDLVAGGFIVLSLFGVFSRWSGPIGAGLIAGRFAWNDWTTVGMISAVFALSSADNGASLSITAMRSAMKRADHGWVRPLQFACDYGATARGVGLVLALMFVFMMALAWRTGGHPGFPAQLAYMIGAMAVIALVDWHRLLSRLIGFFSAEPLIVLFDGTCSYCRRVVGVLHTLETNDRTLFLPLEDPEAWQDRVTNPPPPESLMLDIYAYSQGNWYAGVDSYRCIAARNPVLWLAWPFLALPPFSGIAKAIYRRIADRRVCKIVPKVAFDPVIPDTNLPITMMGFAIFFVTLFGLRGF